jgi:hypothetical protein
MALHIIHANKNSEVLVHSEIMSWVHNHLDHSDKIEAIKPTKKSYIPSHERI